VSPQPRRIPPEVKGDTEYPLARTLREWEGDDSKWSFAAAVRKDAPAPHAPMQEPDRSRLLDNAEWGDDPDEQHGGPT